MQVDFCVRERRCIECLCDADMPLILLGYTQLYVVGCLCLVSFVHVHPTSNSSCGFAWPGATGAIPEIALVLFVVLTFISCFAIIGMDLFGKFFVFCNDDGALFHKDCIYTHVCARVCKQASYITRTMPARCGSRSTAKTTTHLCLRAKVVEHDRLLYTCTKPTALVRRSLSWLPSEIHNQRPVCGLMQDTIAC